MSNTSKEIKYLGRDFDSLKRGLIDFTKNYYPDTYNDFNESSPGMMFLEMAAYVGDVLSYYTDETLKEQLLVHADEKRNVMAIAAGMGYKPKISIPSHVDLDVFQLVPASGSGDTVGPDPAYALKIEGGMQCKSTVEGVDFIVQDPVDFSINNLYDPTEYTVYSIDANGAPNYYLARKTKRAISAEVKQTEVVVDGTRKFFKFQLDATNLIGIQSIYDSDGNKWHEVPYLAQDTIFERVENTALNDPDAAVWSEETPYLLKLKKVPRRFTTRVFEDRLEAQFGAGVSTSPDEELLATPENVGMSLPTGISDLDFSIDPQSPVFTGAYGVAPSNTTLTVTYLVGGGVKSNSPSNSITDVSSTVINEEALPESTPELNSTVLNSVACNNKVAATGGRSGETVEEIRQNALAQFSSQNRAVTREDYIIRSYALPNEFGSVAKVFISPDEQANIATSDVYDTVSNPLALNLYMLGYDNDHRLTTVNRAVKENLKTYLSQYKMLTDSINFRDGFIVNIGVDFGVIPLTSYNANEVLARCIDRMKQYFDIDRWQISQPIVYADIANTLSQVEGVQTITYVSIKNLYDEIAGYSNIAYSIKTATRNGIIYPSLDPCIFEVKYPNNDIKGRIVTF